MTGLERVGDLVSIRKGRRPPTAVGEPFDGSRRLLQIDDLRPDSKRKYVPVEPLQVSVEETDIVMAWDGAYAGLTSFGLSGVLGSTLAALSVRAGRGVYPPYLGWFLRANHSYLRHTAKGSAVPHINPSALADLRLRLPAIGEQRRIAAILDQIDSQCVKLRSVLAYVLRLESDVFQHEFGRLTSPAVRLGDIARTTSGGTPNRADPDNFGGDIAWVKSGELHAGVVTVTEEKITQAALATSSAKLLPIGTVLIAMYGATAGVVGSLGIEAATNQAVCAITPSDRLDPTYLIAALRSKSGELVAKRSGGAQPNLSQGIIRSLEIELPPIELQREFAGRIAEIDTQRDRVQRAIDLHDELFASLQSRAFKGEL